MIIITPINAHFRALKHQMNEHLGSGSSLDARDEEENQFNRLNSMAPALLGGLGALILGIFCGITLRKRK